MRREIKMIFNGEAMTEGAGVKLRRVFGYYETPAFDPFLMLDDLRAEVAEDFIKGFPWHPHRGIETITYVINGDVEHGDSLGNKGIISSGDVQWMTAGSGIVHQEMPKGDENGRMNGFQLWANLPAKDKMIAPRYRGITAEEIPQITLDNGTLVKIIAGSVQGVEGPVKGIAIDPEYMDCTVPAGEHFIHSTPKEYTAFLYVIGGKGIINGQKVENNMLVLFDDGEELAVSGADEAVQFLLVTGKPLNEPIAWRGPIVMNSEEELTLALEEYQNGTFIKNQ